MDTLDGRLRIKIDVDKDGDLFVSLIEIDEEGREGEISRDYLPSEHFLKILKGALTHV